jgi:hypothetical protein
LRCLHTRWGTISGYFNDFQKLANAAGELSGNVPAVYVTLNPVNPKLLARANKRIVKYAKSTTGDQDIVKRRWLPIDFDPVRPSDISSSDLEKTAAMERAKQCREWLTTLGFPAAIFADSGNGYHLDYMIDLPNDDASRDLIQKCLEAIAARFTDDKVSVDLKNFNAARIWKLYGTMACKGDDMLDRPHRQAKILDAKSLRIVSSDLLQKLALLAPEPARSRSNGQYHAFNLDDFISRHGIAITRVSDWNGGRRFVLETCPWNPDHNRGEAYIVQLASGAIAAGCHHNSCSGKGWHELREQFEPGYQERREEYQSKKDHFNSSKESQQQNSSNSSNSYSVSDQPKPELKPEALHGLAGEIVKTIEPYSEADPIGILTNILTSFGNVVGPTPYARVEETHHHLNLFVVQVGDTSKARKGTAWSTPKKMFRDIDSQWSDNRVTGGLSSGEGLVYNVRDPRYQTKPIREDGKIVGYEDVLVDKGEEDRRLLLIEEEFSQALKVMSREGNILSPIIRQAWDHGNLRSLTKNDPNRATGAHISIIAHITSGELLRHLTENEQTNGFANRFCWFWVTRSKCIAEADGVPAELLRPFTERLNDAVNFSRQVGEMRRNAEARAEWKLIYPDLSDAKPGLVGSMIARAEAQVLRLSCLYALLDKSPTIEVDHQRAALALWEYSEQSVKAVFGDLTGDPHIDTAKMALRSKGVLTLTELHDLFGRNVTASEIERVIRTLVKMGLAELDTVTDERGRKSITVLRWATNSTKSSA